MPYELNGSDFSPDQVSGRAIATLLTGLGLGAVFWGVLFVVVAG